MDRETTVLSIGRSVDTVKWLKEPDLANFKNKAQFRPKGAGEVARCPAFNHGEEFPKNLALLSEGRSVLFDPDLSVRWTETAFAQSIFAKAAN